ncbi:MAG TPA: hypothetical protein VNH45_03490 [Gaiellaceae bacterium]|nr:hypothetical protein [Gaiellaceae bacterium]
MKTARATSSRAALAAKLPKKPPARQRTVLFVEITNRQRDRLDALKERERRRLGSRKISRADVVRMILEAAIPEEINAQG